MVYVLLSFFTFTENSFLIFPFNLADIGWAVHIASWLGSTCCGVITIMVCLLVCLLFYTLSHAVNTPTRGHRCSGWSPTFLSHYIPLSFVLLCSVLYLCHCHFNVVRAPFTWNHCSGTGELTFWLCAFIFLSQKLFALFFLWILFSLTWFFISSGRMGYFLFVYIIVYFFSGRVVLIPQENDTLNTGCGMRRYS